MKKNINMLGAELIWVISSLVLTLMFAAMFLGGISIAGDVEFHIHDTYFIVSRWLILTPLFFLINLTIYLIKEQRKLFARTTPNLILLISGLVCVVILAYLIKSITLMTTGWTIYPPLSSLSEAAGQQASTIFPGQYVSNFLIVLQIIIVILLLYVTYRWGTKKTKRVSSNK